MSASVTIATTVSRSAISTGIPAASRSVSTALPSAPVPGSTTTSRVGSTPGPDSTTSPGTRASRRRTAATASMTGPSSASPSRSSSARAASMLARIAPDGLVVAVASTPASKRARPIRPLRASTSAPCDHAGSALWALVTSASAPAASACGGSDGWNPRCAPHAASTTRGMPCACATAASAPTSPTVPTYEGSPTNTARASGAVASAASRAAAVTPTGSPCDGSTAGRTHTGSSPASTSPSSIDRCSVRATTTRSPGRPTARARAWLPWVEPPTENRQRSAPHRRAARDSASATTPRDSFIVSSPA